MALAEVDERMNRTERPGPFATLGKMRVDGFGAQVALGIGVVVAVSLLGWAVRAILPNAFPAALLFPAIVLASLVGGWRAGATAAVLSLMARTFWMAPPAFQGVMSIGALINFVVFALAAAAVVAIGVYPRWLLDRLQGSAEALNERNLQYDALFQSIPEGFAVCDAIRGPDGRLVDYVITEINPALQQLLHVGPEVVGTRLTDSPGDWSRWLQICDRVLNTGKPVSFERYNRITNLWHEVHVSRLTETRMAQLFFDITNRKVGEARQVQAFDELNHRVKNNLAMVSSLLQLQARESKGQVRDQLLKAAARVQSIAEVHDALSRGAGAATVDFGTYLQDLCASLSRSLAIEEQIALRVEAEPQDLAVDTAISLGMVVNELVTNAAKYAYPGGETGAIRVKFARDGDRLLLSVRDDGPGMPEAPGPGGLGMRLVRSLLDQLGGEFRVHPGEGAAFEISLPVEAGAPDGAEVSP
ncbi:MAG TPA: histidine kinase dimerization/phosphoacceptor domain -containing protein [Caulobacteraceae bacterium]|jgi:two-component sensor histidine kinase